MQVLLRVNVPDKPGKQVRIARNVIVGREKGRCDLRIASGEVSRQHCQILVGEFAVLVRDLNSANGTRVNGELIPAQTNFPLSSGDIIAIGPLTLCAELLDDSIDCESSDEFLSQHDALAALDTPHSNAELSSLDILIENRLEDDADDYTSMQPTWDAMPVAVSPADSENFGRPVSGDQLEQEASRPPDCDDDDDIEELELADEDSDLDAGQAVASSGTPVPVQPSGGPDHLESDSIVLEAGNPLDDNLTDRVSEEDLVSEDDLVPLEDLGPYDQMAGNRSEQVESDPAEDQAEIAASHENDRARENDPIDDGLSGFLNQFDSPA